MRPLFEDASLMLEVDPPIGFNPKRKGGVHWFCRNCKAVFVQYGGPKAEVKCPTCGNEDYWDGMYLIRNDESLNLNEDADDFVYELADSMDVSYGEANEFFNNVSYVLAYSFQLAGKKVGQARVSDALRQAFERDPKIFDAIRRVGNDTKAMADIVKNIQSERSAARLDAAIRNMGAWLKKVGIMP